MKRRGPSGRGFSLVESLVAVSVAATALSGFYGALSTGILLGNRASEQAAQVLVATTVLDRVGTVVDLNTGLTENGTLDGHDWTLSIGGRPTDDMRLGAIRDGELAFVFVTVEALREGGAPVVLRGIRYLETPL